MTTPGVLAYPAALDDAVSLLETANNATTTLSSSITSASTTLTVGSTALFPSTGALSIDTEILYYTGKTGTTFTGCLRGQDGTTAASHSSGVAIERRVIARDHAVLAAAVVALEGVVGTRTNPAQSGAVRLGSAQWVTSRNNANNADLNLLRATSGDALELMNGVVSITAGGVVTASSDIITTAAGSTTGSPRQLGATPMTTNNAVRFIFGDSNNCVQNAFNGKMQIQSYHGLVLSGARQGSVLAFDTTTGSEPGVQVVGQTAARRVLQVMAAASQSANILEVTDSSSNVYAYVGSAGGLLVPHAAGLGYGAGAGGTVTQITSKLTAVTLNKICGQITTAATALAAAAEANFTVNNSTVGANDVVVACIVSGGTSGSYLVSVTAVAAGSFDITLANVSAGSLSQAVVIGFAVIKAVTS